MTGPLSFSISRRGKRRWSMLPAASVSGGWLPITSKREQGRCVRPRGHCGAMGDLGLFGVELSEEYGGPRA